MILIRPPQQGQGGEAVSADGFSLGEFTSRLAAARAFMPNSGPLRHQQEDAAPSLTG
jgi:hypothetical protein